MQEARDVRPSRPKAAKKVHEGDRPAKVARTDGAVTARDIRVKTTLPRAKRSLVGLVAVRSSLFDASVVALVTWLATLPVDSPEAKRKAKDMAARIGRLSGDVVSRVMEIMYRFFLIHTSNALLFLAALTQFLDPPSTSRPVTFRIQDVGQHSIDAWRNTIGMWHHISILDLSKRTSGKRSMHREEALYGIDAWIVLTAFGTSAAAKSIREINLNGCDLSLDDLAVLRRFPQLRVLVLPRKLYPAKAKKVTLFSVLLGNCPQLEILDARRLSELANPSFLVSLARQSKHTVSSSTWPFPNLRRLYLRSFHGPSIGMLESCGRINEFHQIEFSEQPEADAHPKIVSLLSKNLVGGYFVGTIGEQVLKQIQSYISDQQPLETKDKEREGTSNRIYERMARWTDLYIPTASAGEILPHCSSLKSLSLLGNDYLAALNGLRDPDCLATLRLISDSFTPGDSSTAITRFCNLHTLSLEECRGVRPIVRQLHQLQSLRALKIKVLCYWDIELIMTKDLFASLELVSSLRSLSLSVHPAPRSLEDELTKAEQEEFAARGKVSSLRFRHESLTKVLIDVLGQWSFDSESTPLEIECPRLQSCSVISKAFDLQPLLASLRTHSPLLVKLMLGSQANENGMEISDLNGFPLLEQFYLTNIWPRTRAQYYSPPTLDDIERNDVGLRRFRMRVGQSNHYYPEILSLERIVLPTLRNLVALSLDGYIGTIFSDVTLPTLRYLRIWQILPLGSTIGQMHIGQFAPNMETLIIGNTNIGTMRLKNCTQLRYLKLGRSFHAERVEIINAPKLKTIRGLHHPRVKLWLLENVGNERDSYDRWDAILTSPGDCSPKREGPFVYVCTLS